jgi:hypothetical protein
VVCRDRDELVAIAVGSSYKYLTDPEHADPAEILREAILYLAPVASQ